MTKPGSVHAGNANTIVLMLSVGYALALFQRMAFAQISPDVASKFDLDQTQIADLGAVFFWTYLVLQIPCGLFADALGSRRAAIFGLASSAVGSLFWAMASSLAMLMLARILIAVGAVLGFVAMIRYASLHFPRSTGTVIGRSTFIGNLGAIAAGAPLLMALALMSYCSLWMWLAAATGLLALLIALFSRESHGLAGFRNSMAAALPEVRHVFMSAWCYVGISLLAGLTGAYYAFSTLTISPLLEGYGIDPESRGLILSVMAIGYAVGTYSWALIGDRTDRKFLVLLVALSGAMLCWIQLLLTARMNAWLITSVVFMLSVCSGAYSLVYSIICTRFPDVLRGTAIAIINCGIPLGAAICQMAMARMESRHMLVPTALACLGACAIALAVLIQQNRRHPVVQSGNRIALSSLRR